MIGRGKHKIDEIVQAIVEAGVITDLIYFYKEFLKQFFKIHILKRQCKLSFKILKNLKFM